MNIGSCYIGRIDKETHWTKAHGQALREKGNGIYMLLAKIHQPGRGQTFRICAVALARAMAQDVFKKGRRTLVEV